MSSTEPVPIPEEPSRAVAEAAVPAPAIEPQSPTSRGRAWAFAVGAGILAGLLSGAVGELAQGAFRPRLFEVVVLQMRTIQATAASENAAAFNNATLTFGLLGLVTGLCLGLGGGLAARLPSRGVLIGIAAGLVGACVGAGASLAMLPLYFRQMVPDPNDVTGPMIVHGGIWIPVGAVAGAAFALGMAANARQVLKAAIGGILGAALATVLFHVLSASFFPDSNYTEPLATSAVVRLLGRLLVPLLAAVGAARALLGRSRDAARPVVTGTSSPATP